MHSLTDLSRHELFSGVLQWGNANVASKTNIDAVASPGRGKGGHMPLL